MNFLFLTFLLFAAHITAESFVGQVTKAGYYRLEENVTYDPNDEDAIIIRISASDVILDLNDRTLSQDLESSVTGVYGIVVDPHLNNVIIQNGVIREINGVGVVVGEGCSNLLISNVRMYGCGSGCMWFNGVDGSEIADSSIEACTFAQSCHCQGGDSVLRVRYCTNVRVEDASLSGNHNDNNLIKIVALENCTSCFFNKISILNNYAYSFIGLDLSSIERCGFNDCTVQFNQATGSNQSMVAYSLSGNDNSNNRFKKCTAVQNSADGNAFIFNIVDNSTDNMFERCKVLGNIGKDVIGFRLVSNTTNKQNSFVDCIANNNRATTNDASGFYINGSDDGIMIHCSASFNTGDDYAAGLLFDDNSGGSNWFIKECNFIKNQGRYNAYSYGVRLREGKGNSFINNFAFNNGGYTSNQLSGIPNGSKSQTSTSNLNSGLGFTNFQVVP